VSLELTLHTAPEVPLEAEILSPDRLQSLSPAAIEKARVMHGNRPLALAEFFRIGGQPGDEIHLHGDLARVKHVGAGMSAGRLVIHGDIGAHLGAGMSGGEIRVEGNAGDWVGPEMRGGSIFVAGDAGHMVGAAYRGSAMGMLGGEIIITGRAGNEIGHAMRSGSIAVGGDAGDFSGVNMLAGTIVVCGRAGNRTGAGMKRGSIVLMSEAEILPTFSYDCRYHPVILRLCLSRLADKGLSVDAACIKGEYERYSGDAIELNRGEILIYKS
jgi:formylmethanofuran dehydrogenase subunit C